MGKKPNSQDKKMLRDYYRENARAFHCRSCGVVFEMLYKHPTGVGYVCGKHRNG